MKLEDAIELCSDIRGKQSFVKHVKLLLKCEVCEEDHVACLDFHHIKEKEKCFGISDVIRSSSYSLVDIKEELKKCIVICGNCHQELHHED